MLSELLKCLHCGWLGGYDELEISDKSKHWLVRWLTARRDKCPNCGHVDEFETTF